MKEPRDFRKSLYVTQGLGTAMYLLAGAGVYGIAGDATWVKSPINTTLQSGPAFYAVQIMIVLHITFVALITGTFVVRAINRNLRPLLEKHLFHSQGARLDVRFEQIKLQTSSSSVSQSLVGDADDTDAGHIQEVPHHTYEHDGTTLRGRVVWAISSLVGYGGAMLVAMVIPYFSEILGLIASLISTQVSAHRSTLAHHHLNPCRPPWRGPHTRGSCSRTRSVASRSCGAPQPLLSWSPRS